VRQQIEACVEDVGVDVVKTGIDSRRAASPQAISY
jgi:hydroxymethylpyrimidine/phosphomethylpyrimidine kinase